MFLILSILCRGTIVDLGIGSLACEHGRGGRRDRFGQKAGLQGSLWQGPERAPEPPLRRDGRESHWTSGRGRSEPVEKIAQAPAERIAPSFCRHPRLRSIKLIWHFFIMPRVRQLESLSMLGY